MSNKQNIVKNQHYIPESLLWHFANTDGKFFEVLLNSKKIYPSNPGNSMCEKFVYEHENLKVNTVENFFAKIETDVAPLIKNLIETIQGYNAGQKQFIAIKNGVEGLLSIFILFYYRSGALLTEFSSMDSQHKIPLLSKKILNQDYIHDLADMVKRSYNFAIIESHDDFLLSDQFVSTAALKIKARFFDISNRHMGLKETIILIPITSSYYAVYWHTENNFFIKSGIINKLDENEIKLVNKAIINNSYTKSIALKKERIVEILDSFNVAFPSQVFAGGNPQGFSTGAIKKKEVFFDFKDEQAFDLLELAGFSSYRDLGRNDPCGCKSGKKFKRCHEEIYDRIKFVIASFGEKRYDYSIPNAGFVELPVDRWSGYSVSSR